MILIPHGWITSSVADLRPEVVPPCRRGLQPGREPCLETTSVVTPPQQLSPGT